MCVVACVQQGALALVACAGGEYVCACRAAWSDLGCRPSCLSRCTAQLSIWADGWRAARLGGWVAAWVTGG
eukprot:338025-Chlamydomonas_euryale.AAC.2